MSDDSEKDKEVVALIKAGVWDYAGELLFSDKVSERQREMAVRELADAFNAAHQELVESRKRWGTEEGKAELERFKSGALDTVRKYMAERQEAWAASVKEQRERSCSHHTFRQKS